MLSEFITTDQFERIMECLNEKDVWIQLVTSITNINLFYPDFEFSILENDKYQFGTNEIDSAYIPFSINIDDIESINRDIMLPTVSSEQLILGMCDGSEIIVEFNC
jgi:hypothetical protein